MKKAGVLLTVLLISILLLTNITLAQTANDNETGNESDLSITNQPLKNQSLEKGLVGLKKGVEGLDKYVEYDIEIPEKLRLIARIVLGIDQNKILLQNLIILIALWILFYLFFNEILATFALFSEATMRITALILVILLAAIGALNSFTIFLFNIGDNLKFLEDWSAGALAFWLILGLILWMIIHRILKHFKQMKEKTEAKERGWFMVLALGVANSMSKAFHKIAGGSTYRVEKDSQTP